MEEYTDNIVLAVHPAAPYKNSGASDLSFFKRREYRKNCIRFLRYAKRSNYTIVHLRDVVYHEPPLEKKFKVKADIEIPTRLNEGTPMCIPIRGGKKFNVYVLGAYAGACVATAVGYFQEYAKSFYPVVDCIVSKYENALASEDDGEVKLGVLVPFGAKEITSEGRLG